MKTILIAVVFAAVAAFITYKLTIKAQTGASYVFQTPGCEFVKLKIATTEEQAATDFENLLLTTVDPTGDHGSVVRIRYHTAAGKVVEDSGPTSDGKFSHGNPTPGCADGSMHNTQRVNAMTQKDYKAVIDSLDFSTTSTTSSPAVPTSTP